MATKSGIFDRNASDNGSVVVVTWSSLAHGDDGSMLQFSDYADRSAQVVGTFGEFGSLVLECSNDGVNFSTLSDPQGNPLVFTTSKLEQVLEVARYVRPKVTAGDATTSLTVILCMRKAK